MATLTVNTTADIVNAGDELLSLREAIATANTGDVIVLGAGEYTLTLMGAGEDGGLTGDLDIVSKSITIQGAGRDSTFIQGGTLDDLSDSSDRVFDVLTGSTLMLDNVTVRRGNVTGSGGGIQNRGTLRIANAMVSFNSSSTNGGAIATDTGTVTLTNTTLFENAASVDGGGLHHSLGNVTVTSSTLSNNTSQGEGGGFFANQGTVAIADTTVAVNNSQTNGGGITLQNSTIALANTIITNNRANDNGGGFRATNSTATLSQSRITNNDSTTDGGGISTENSNFFFENGEITGNSSANSGGGGLVRDSTVTLTGSVVQFNSAMTTGGGLFVSGTTTSSTTLNVSSSRIRQNTATNAGGIFSNNSTVNFDQSSLSTNIANANGAGLFQESSTAEFNQSTIDGNVATVDGGGILSQNGSIANLRNTTIANNSSGGAGGGLFNRTGNSQATLINTTVTGNQSVFAGGLLADDATTTLINSIVANSTGGNIRNGGGGSATIAAVGNRSLIDADAVNVMGAVPLVDNPMLAGLANNGGPTQTAALLAGSPAIDQSLGAAEAVDQRGAAAVGSRDLGAFEAIAAPEIDLLGLGDNLLAPGERIDNNDTGTKASNGTDFGELDTTTGSRTHTFEIQNLSSGTPLMFTGTPTIAITGAHAADFTVAGTVGDLLVPLNQVRFTITFDPSNVGARTATVTIANNDSDEGPYTFSLSGTGTGAMVPPTIPPPSPLPDGETLGGIPNLRVQSGGATLFSAELGAGLGLTTGFGSRTERSLQIANTGDGILRLATVTVPPDFELVQTNGAPFPNGTELAPGTMVEGVLVLVGDRLEPRMGILQISSNDPDTPIFSVPLTGTIQFTPQPPRPVDFSLARLQLDNARLDNGVRGRPGQRVIVSPSPGTDTTLVGQDSQDNLVGLGGNDNLVGLDGNDVLQGFQGADQLEGGAGDDRLFGGSGDDRILSGGGNDLARGNPGSDRITGDDGADFLLGDGDDDFVDGAGGDDVILGGAGLDSLAGGTGNDVIQGGAGSDLLAGEGGEDQLFGEDGGDRLDGGTGNDALDGGNGNDVLFGGPGSDRLAGQAGDDILLGGAGDDVLVGGSGADQFWVDSDPLANSDALANGQNNGQNNETDVVLDFEDGMDLIAIAGLSPVDTLTWVDVSNTMGNGVSILVNGTPILQLNNLNSTVISAADFVI